MSVVTTGRKPDKDLVAAAEGFAEEIAARAAEIEKNRFLPQDIAQRFAEAGLYRLCVPEAYGGHEAHPGDLVKVVERLARADGSAAWCVFIGATSGLVAGFLQPEEAQRVFGDPLTITAGVFAPRGKAVRAVEKGVEGYRVNGRWQWGSGSRNASYISGGAMILGDDGKPEMAAEGIPQNRMMMFDAADVTLHDTWDVSGLCGTGSTDFEVKDLFVPAARAVSLISDKPLPRPLYCFPTFGLLGIGIAAVSLGLARGSIDTLVDLAGGKTPQGSSKPLALRAKAQLDVSQAEALTRSARAFLMEAIDAAWDAAVKEGEITVAHRRDIRLATTHAVQSAARAVDLMYTLAGGSSVYRGSPLQRQFRDVHVATQHMMVSDATYELTGRLLLGVPTNTAML
ncbi:Acyl-CoA dehydrogenase type 2 domain [Parvibaculum lavamentivorans DS-1]|uniref:Acyl-CoA dehydrogenase type 2 domain n=1 Tax=Parvibaculum lavamentivorans (strain DS-1 / DSM 13023 / NCIMB 13966) TaxID=402881 RepID=A7HSV4_PARL1|nr:acyl-CoA dehydrogenase family protein [Parvibaculum lavamentivorans]ABS62987.1 Acyl-CoA dehydrogenase type 2 domain [Parvibaculum lavamentivorans DS-1]